MKVHTMMLYSILLFASIMDFVNSATEILTALNVTPTSVYDAKSDSTVNPSVQKWLSAEKGVKQLVTSAIKTILPSILKWQEELNLSSNCSRGLLKFLTGLTQMKTWAYRMFDSSGKLPNGILSGSINTFGDYDTCIDTVVPKSFRGQYCLVEVNPSVPPRTPFVSYDSIIPEFFNFTKRQDSILGEFLKKAMYFHHLKIRSSVCVPSTCTTEEVQIIASKVIRMVGIEFDVFVPNCEIKVENVVFSTNDIVIITVLSTIIILAFVATSADVYLQIRSNMEQEHLNVLLKCLLCFSFYTNGRRLLKKDENPESIKIFHGMKVITILWVALNHTYLYLNYQALSSLLNARETGKEFAFQFIANGFLNVETFFFISAVLVAYGVMKMRGEKINVFLYIFRRLWRLTPPFMFVIAFVFLLPHLGSGPVWKETVVDGLTAKCKNNWWTNLMYFNNFISKSEMCLNWTWYIPVDTHLYFISLLILIPLKRNVKLAFIINGVILCLGIILSAMSHVYYKLHPTAIYVYIHPEDINYYVDRGYFRTYLHVSSYNVGLTVGYILAKKQQLQIPRVYNIIGWITAFSLGISVLYGVYDWNQGNVPGIFVSTLYACTSKLVWSLALAWVTISCMTGHGGIATTILSWDAFVPLGRLTYMMYLVHPIVQHVYFGTTRDLIRSDHRSLVFLYCGNILLGFILACIFSLLFESPFMALEKIMFSSMAKKNSIKKEKDLGEQKNKFEFKLQTNDTCDYLKNESNVFTVNFKKIVENC